MEEQARQGLHAFLAHIAPGVDPVPGLEWICLLGFNRDATVHLLYWLFSILFDLYSKTRRLFTCQGKLSNKGLPLVVELTHRNITSVTWGESPRLIGRWCLAIRQVRS